MAQLRFDPETSIIIVQARIVAPRGVEYADLVFDTGATYVMLPWKLANAVGLPIDPGRTTRSVTASSVETSPRTTIPEIVVLGYGVKDVDCIVRDLPPESTVDGLLGLSFLKNFDIRMDFSKGVLGLNLKKG